MEKKELLGQRHKPLLVPILYESDEEMLHPRTVREIQIASNFAVLKSSIAPRKDDTWTTAMPSAKRIKSASNEKEKEQQQYHLAIETALLVQKEIEQWENSIRELEFILSQSEPPPPHRRSQSTHRSVVPDVPNADETIDTVMVKDDTATNHNHNNDDAAMIPHRSISVSSTETRVAVIDEDDVTVVVDTTPPPGPVVWETAATVAVVSLSSASASSST
jgi:hypothetical protein